MTHVALGLKPAIEERPSDQFARGQIFDQQAAAGTDVYVVKEARLFVSAGPPAPARKPVPIPDFRGWSPLKAQDWFARYGLKPAIDERPSDQFARGQIFDQQPAPGTDVYVVKDAQPARQRGSKRRQSRRRADREAEPAPTSDARALSAKKGSADTTAGAHPDFTGWSRVSAERWLASYGLKAAIDDAASIDLHED